VTSIRSIISRIDDWQSRTGMTDEALGYHAAGNARALERIRSGSASISTLEVIMQYIRTHPAEEFERERKRVTAGDTIRAEAERTMPKFRSR